MAWASATAAPYATCTFLGSLLFQELGNMSERLNFYFSDLLGDSGDFDNPAVSQLQKSTFLENPI